MSGHYFDVVIITALTVALLVVYFALLSVLLVSFFSSQDRSQLRTLSVGMKKSKKMAKIGLRSPVKGHLVMDPRGQGLVIACF